MDEKKVQKIEVKIEEKDSGGIFSNVLFVHVNDSEFVLDFGFLQPQEPKAKIVGRVITTPAHAKRFLMTLENSIKKFEENFGKINIEKKNITIPPIKGGSVN